MRQTPLIVLVAAGLALCGCSGAPDAAEPQVATVRSAGPTASRAADPADQRPLVPLEATDEERDALWKIWTDCVTEEGGPGYEEPKMIFKYEQQGDPEAKRVRAACLPKEPETYEERLKRTDNAAFRDSQRQWYACAKKEGYKVTPADEDGRFGITEVGPQGDFQSPKMENCRKEAFKR